MGQESGHGLTGSLLRISEVGSQGVVAAVFSSGGMSGKNPLLRSFKLLVAFISLWL